MSVLKTNIRITKLRITAENLSAYMKMETSKEKEKVKKMVYKR